MVRRYARRVVGAARAHTLTGNDAAANVSISSTINDVSENVLPEERVEGN